MPITLWAEHATKLNNFIQDRDNGEPVIVILQFGKKNIFQGLFLLGIFITISLS